MFTPLFFPPARIVPYVERTGQVFTLRELLASAEAPCRASGRWTERQILLAVGDDEVLREPGEWGLVRIGIKERSTERDAARYALLVLAYSLMDIVARESIRGECWTKPSSPRGRPRTGTARSNAQRQQTLRSRQREKIELGK
jgi:hypothetical protein